MRVETNIAMLACVVLVATGLAFADEYARTDWSNADDEAEEIRKCLDVFRELQFK